MTVHTTPTAESGHYNMEKAVWDTKDLLKVNVLCHNEFNIIRKEKLKKLILSRNSKSCHLDPIPTNLLKKKEIVDEVLPIFDFIVNESLQLTHTRRI